MGGVEGRGGVCVGGVGGRRGVKVETRDRSEGAGCGTGMAHAAPHHVTRRDATRHDTTRRADVLCRCSVLWYESCVETLLITLIHASTSSGVDACAGYVGEVCVCVWLRGGVNQTRSSGALDVYPR